MLATSPEDLSSSNISSPESTSTPPQIVKQALQNWGAFLSDLARSTFESTLSLVDKSAESGLNFAGRAAGLAAKLNFPLAIAEEFDDALALLDSPEEEDDDWPAAA
jgi:hypothetical protein